MEATVNLHSCPSCGLLGTKRRRRERQAARTAEAGLVAGHQALARQVREGRNNPRKEAIVTTGTPNTEDGPEPDQLTTVTRSTLLRIYLSGYGSGVATSLANTGVLDRLNLSEEQTVQALSDFARGEVMKAEKDPAVVAEIMRTVDDCVEGRPHRAGRSIKMVNE